MYNTCPKHHFFLLVLNITYDWLLSINGASQKINTIGAINTIFINLQQKRNGNIHGFIFSPTRGIIFHIPEIYE